MNKKLALFACALGSFGLYGCVADSPYNEGPYVSQQVNAPAPAPTLAPTPVPASATAAAPYRTPSPCDDNYLDAACQSQFVNYTNVAADYRQYGERSPRDVMVSQAAAGNNMTAVIPPSIENEVIEYQANIAQPVEVPASAIDASAVAAPGAAVVATEVTTQTNAQPVEEDEVDDWMADEGENLKSLLMDWSDKAGWRLVWDTNRNYTLTAGAMFRGTFEDVSSALIRAFARARPAPVATFYKGNRVLVVETLEDENAY